MIWLTLLHAHDHTWRSDWPWAVRVEACRLIIQAMIRWNLEAAAKQGSRERRADV